VAVSLVVGAFQGTIDRLLILTLFMPILIDQSGNTGSQALAITLRGMALGGLEPGKERSLIRKEALLGLLNGALVGLVAAVGMYALASVQHLPQYRHQRGEHGDIVGASRASGEVKPVQRMQIGSSTA
jgi:magnesium transporter